MVFIHRETSHVCERKTSNEICAAFGILILYGLYDFINCDVWSLQGLIKLNKSLIYWMLDVHFWIWTSILKTNSILKQMSMKIDKVIIVRIGWYIDDFLSEFCKCQCPIYRYEFKDIIEIVSVKQHLFSPSSTHLSLIIMMARIIFAFFFLSFELEIYTHQHIRRYILVAKSLLL